MREKRYALTIAYDGTSYGGWQRQPNAVTIQQLIEEALQIATRESLKVTGSGRTDAGVHALKQVAHFSSNKPLNTERLFVSLNGLLPRDIRILEINEVSDTFHARYSAKVKCYHYHITLGPVQLPFDRLYSWHCRERFDIPLMRQAATLLVGTHDFTSFANEPNMGSVAKNPVRDLRRLDIFEHETGLRLEFEANGFLYKMVRNLSGTLYEVAVKKRDVKSVAHLLEAKDRKLAGRAAPPHGLFLAWVDYKEAIDSKVG